MGWHNARTPQKMTNDTGDLYVNAMATLTYTAHNDKLEEEEQFRQKCFVCYKYLIGLVSLGVVLLVVGTTLYVLGETGRREEYTTMVFTGKVAVDDDPFAGTYAAFCEVTVPGPLDPYKWFDLDHVGTNQTEVVQFATSTCAPGATVSGSCVRDLCNDQPKIRDQDTAMAFIGFVLLSFGGAIMLFIVGVVVIGVSFGFCCGQARISPPAPPRRAAEMV